MGPSVDTGAIPADSTNKEIMGESPFSFGTVRFCYNNKNLEKHL